MRVIVITPPDPVVVWEEADARLRLDGDATQRVDVEAMIAAATGNLDGPGGWLGRALGPQTLEARFDSFLGGGAFEHHRHRRHFDRTCGTLRLPFPPIIDITSVKYIDTNGVEQTLSPSAYVLRGDDLSPVYGTGWPTPRCEPEAVRVQFRAGYAGDNAADPLVPSVPAPIKTAILLMTGDLYDNRSTTLDARKNAAVQIPMSTTVEDLLAPYRERIVV